MEKLNAQNVNMTSSSSKEKCPHCGSDEGFEGGTVLDIFMGSGTTAIVALQLDRKYLGIELNPEYIKIAQDRIKPYKNKLF